MGKKTVSKILRVTQVTGATGIESNVINWKSKKNRPVT
jgi:hypothetical protein